MICPPVRKSPKHKKEPQRQSKLSVTSRSLGWSLKLPVINKRNTSKTGQEKRCIPLRVTSSTIIQSQYRLISTTYLESLSISRSTAKMVTTNKKNDYKKELTQNDHVHPMQNGLRWLRLMCRMINLHEGAFRLPRATCWWNIIYLQQPESREDTHPRASQQLKKKSPTPHFHQLM